MQTIPIFFASNDNYIPYVSVMMQSIMENAAVERKYVFYILHTDIKIETIEKLQKQAETFPCFSLGFIDMSPYIKNYDFFTSRHITTEAYFRLFIPYIIDVKKAIYLDGDMVCNVDISELFDTDISDNLLAGVRDIAVAWNYQPKNMKDKSFLKIYEYMLSTEKPSEYINSGMLLLNCEKIRQVYSEKDIADTIFSRDWQVHDQDVINFLAKDKILLLDYEWDFMPTDCAKYLPPHLKNKYDEAQKKPKIIHYKPYSVWWYIPKFELFWKYATRTPFIDDIVKVVNKNNDLEKLIEKRIEEWMKENVELVSFWKVLKIKIKNKLQKLITIRM